MSLIGVREEPSALGPGAQTVSSRCGHRVALQVQAFQVQQRPCLFIVTAPPAATWAGYNGMNQKRKRCVDRQGNLCSRSSRTWISLAFQECSVGWFLIPSFPEVFPAQNPVTLKQKLRKASSSHSPVSQLLFPPSPNLYSQLSLPLSLSLPLPFLLSSSSFLSPLLFFLFFGH